ncbi:TPA: response regulator [Bacillus paranthracis]
MIRILFVDDTLFFRHQFQNILSKLGKFKVQGFKNGWELIEHYRELYDNEVQVDLIFIDFILEADISAFDTLKEIMEINPEAKIIIMGGGHKEDVIKGIKLGAKWFIQKPFDEENIKFALNRFIKLN